MTVILFSCIQILKYFTCRGWLAADSYNISCWGHRLCSCGSRCYSILCCGKGESVPAIYNGRVMTALNIPLLRTFLQCHVVHKIAGRMY